MASSQSMKSDEHSLHAAEGVTVGVGVVVGVKLDDKLGVLVGVGVGVLVGVTETGVTQAQLEFRQLE